MADPILPDFFRAQAIFHGHSGLPEDVYVNTFVFRNDVDGQPATVVHQTIADQLFGFYNDIHAPGTAPLRSYMSSRTLTSQFKVKVYDLGQAPPRTPHEREFQMGQMASGALPSEVALCLSYYAERNIKRRRGRIYFGPLAQGVIVDAAGEPARPTNALINALAGAGAWLEDEGFGGVNWHLLSGMDGNAYEITGGWVDNAFDTQRRRGEEATARTLWGNLPS